MRADQARGEPPEPVRDLDWAADQARHFADRAVDLWQEFLERLPSLPVSGAWSSGQVAAGVIHSVPDEPLSEDDLFDYFRQVVFDWSMYPGHPRFMAYISGAGTVPGAPADLLAAGLNMNAGGWRLAPSATEIELALVRWFAEQFGLPASAGGLMVSGGAMANFVALKAARDAKAPWDVRNKGVSAGPPLRVYASEEVHVVTDRAMSFAAPAAYVYEDKERSGHGIDLGMMGPQFSRGFQAFKVWVSLLAHGRKAYARRISHDAGLARYMGARVEARPEFELSTPVSLSICCFRYVPPGLGQSSDQDEYLNQLNQRLMTEIQLDGRAFLSNAVLDGRFVLRACIVNFRTEAEDVDALLDVAAELGASLDAELRPKPLRASTG